MGEYNTVSSRYTFEEIKQLGILVDVEGQSGLEVGGHRVHGSRAASRIYLDDCVEPRTSQHSGCDSGSIHHTHETATAARDGGVQGPRFVCHSTPFHVHSTSA
jgi:hypothetical protein